MQTLWERRFFRAAASVAAAAALVLALGAVPAAGQVGRGPATTSTIPPVVSATSTSTVPPQGSATSVTSTTPPAAPTGPTSGDTLPFTGVEAAPSALAAGLAVAAGGSLVALAGMTPRRRRRRPPV
jgi:hypothetical protein